MVEGRVTEVGRLRSVLLHRPGAELRRLTPRKSCPLDREPVGSASPPAVVR